MSIEKARTHLQNYRSPAEIDAIEALVREVARTEIERWENDALHESMHGPVTEISRASAGGGEDECGITDLELDETLGALEGKHGEGWINITMKERRLFARLLRDRIRRFDTVTPTQPAPAAKGGGISAPDIGLTNEQKLFKQIGHLREQLATATARIRELKGERDEAIINLRNAREGTIIESALQPGEYKELAEARNELHCCDDIPLDQGLASGIAALRYQRDQLIEWNGQNAVRAERAEDRADGTEATLAALRDRAQKAKDELGDEFCPSPRVRKALALLTDPAPSPRVDDTATSR